MDDELAQKIVERLAELPEDVRKAVQSADLTHALSGLGEKYKLHIDQVGELENETLMVMLGFTAPEQFEERVVKAIGIGDEQAKQLVSDIDRDVFLPVRASLKQFLEQKKSGIPKPQQMPAGEPHPADAMLSQKTVTKAPGTPSAAAGAPKPYTTDPYREPIQ